MAASGEPIERWLQVIWNLKGSDLHITPASPPLVRIDGVLTPIEGEPMLTAADTERLVFAVLADMGPRLERDRQVDFAFAWGSTARFRGNAYLQRGTHAMALRLIPYDIPTAEQIGLPQVVVDKFLSSPSGLVLVTGPTGSGKSTTLAAMIGHINQTRACHILTIEDPIEYVHRHARAMVNQREIGSDAVSFPQALRSALREDPDVVLVGEMRDQESIAAALSIAETGHLVFGTLHTNDTSQAVDRLIDVFPAEQQPQIKFQLSATLVGVVYQRLLARVGGGRVGAHEVMVATHAVRNMIREGRSRQLRNTVATGQQEGMITFEAAVSALVGKGLVTYEEAVAASLYPKEVMRARAS